MALTIIPDPTALPTVQTDYVEQNNLISAIFLDPDKVFPVDFDNDEIPAGTVIQLGGTKMKAVTAEAITGTKSNFVKIDHTARTAAYVASLTGVSWSTVYNGYYDASGDLYLFDEATAYFDGDITTRKMIYSSLRKQIFEEIGVTKPNWTYPVSVGSALSIAGAGSSAICRLTDTDIAFIDDLIEELRTYRWNGSSWSLVGAGLSIAGIGFPALTTLDATTIAFIDRNLDELRTYEWDGANWSLVGAGLSIAGIGFPALTTLNSTDIAFIDDLIEELRTYRWDGSSWSLVGAGLSIAGIGHPALTTLNSTDIAFIDVTPKLLSRYRWNGSSWSLLGTALSIPAIGNPTITALTENDIAFTFVSALSVIYTYRWDIVTLTWGQIGTGLILGSRDGPAISKVTNSEIAYFDSTEEELIMYHMGNEPKVF